MSTEFRRVVAGVSTKDGRQVVRWAAAEAHARHAELRLVTALPGPSAADPYLPNEVAGEHRAGAARLLAELTEEVAAEWPDLAVVTEVGEGPPAGVLRDATDEADLLVVGADDAGPFVEAISGSVPGDLLTTSRCPLVVVPRQDRPDPSASAHIVVALDESATAQAALAYGYVAAARGRRPLHILRCVATGRLGEAASVAQSRLLIAYGELYPDVAVTIDVVPDDPRQALVTASRHAALLVLGSRGRGRLVSGLFGSVSRDLIRHSGCPVVIARTQPSAVTLAT